MTFPASRTQWQTTRKTQAGAKTKQEETDLVDRMVWVVDQQCVVVEEDGLGFRKRNAMALPIQSVKGSLPDFAPVFEAFAEDLKRAAERSAS